MTNPRVHSETLHLQVDVEGLERLAVPILVIQMDDPVTAEATAAIRAIGVEAIEHGVLVLDRPASVYWVTP